MLLSFIDCSKAEGEASLGEPPNALREYGIDLDIHVSLSLSVFQ